MKKIIELLLIFMILGMLISTVSAVELKPYDFGDYTLNVPGDKWHYVNTPMDGSSNGNGVFITRQSLDDLRMSSFDEYFDSFSEDYELIEDGDGLKVYEGYGRYTVYKYGGDEIYIIADEDLDEAKAIADSAQLESTETSSNESKYVSESDAFDNLFTMDVPSKSEFDKINEEGNESDVQITFQDSYKDISVFYIESEDIDNVMDSIYQQAENYNENLTTEGNLTIVETVDGVHWVHVSSDNKLIELSSSKTNLDTLKEMAKSIEFEE